MTDWTEGYVAEIGYAHAFYAELAPAHLAFALLLRGIRPPAALAGGTFSYGELGCGQGLTSNLLAALYPRASFQAVDFLPAHIAAARRLATAAGSANIAFSDESFAAFAERDGPPFDVIALHGVWSWVSADNRARLIQILRRRLSPDGVALVSYNCLPGWAAQMPVRRLLRDHVTQGRGPLPDRIDKALRFARRLAGQEDGYFARVPAAAAHLNGLDQRSDSYLAHEYLNRDWAPFYHADVAAQMAEAKLSFAASATLPDNLPEALPDGAAALLDETADPAWRETLRDYLTHCRFRRDIFLRGPLPLGAAERRVRLGEQRLGLTLEHPACEQTADPPLAERLITLLATEPRSLDAVADALPEASFAEILRLAASLAAAGSVVVVPPTPADSAGATRFNAAVLDDNRWSADLRQLASPVLGGGIVTGLLDRLFLLARRLGRDPADFAGMVLAERGKRLQRHGQILDSAEDNLREMRRLATVFAETTLPDWRRLGLTVPGTMV